MNLKPILIIQKVNFVGKTPFFITILNIPDAQKIKLAQIWYGEFN
jgi:hypothetical protein